MMAYLVICRSKGADVEKISYLNKLKVYILNKDELYETNVHPTERSTLYCSNCFKYLVAAVKCLQTKNPYKKNTPSPFPMRGISNFT